MDINGNCIDAYACLTHFLFTLHMSIFFVNVQYVLFFSSSHFCLLVHF